jgi:3-dehydroquinate synthase
MKLTLSLPSVPERSSEVTIGEDAAEQVAGDLALHAPGRSLYWVWDENVWPLWAKKAAELGWPSPGSGRAILFTASEPNKRLAAVELLARRLVQAGAGRDSAIVAVGGGVTGDVAGFLASIYMRGVPHFQLPTTLLAQVDSSIGGKTGVDLPEGKNLVGSFHQPELIWMDPCFLTTLPPDAFRQGMAEVIKTALIGDEVLWKYLEGHSDKIRRRETEPLVRIISACCIFKARVVEADEKESGLRRLLNLGHTVGHAIEKLSGYRVAHGDAVAMGLVAAGRLSEALGRFPASELDRLEKLCIQWGLPVRIPGPYSPESIIEAIRADKKWVGATLHFILPVRIGEAVEYTGLDPAKFKPVLASLREK